MKYLMVPTMSATYPVAPAPTWVTHPETNRARRCLTSQRYPDTLRIAVKASSYSKAVYVSDIANGTPCHYTTPSFFLFLSRTSTVPTDIQRSIARSCSTAWARLPSTSDTIVVSDGTHHERDLPSRPCSNLGHPSRD